jgi:hypothetical protein
LVETTSPVCMSFSSRILSSLGSLIFVGNQRVVVHG